MESKDRKWWLGPFTTTFSYPSSCNVAVQECTSGCTQFWQAQTCSNNPYNTQGVQDNAACWPPRYDDAAISTGEAVLGWGYYSPALSCPGGYTAACSATSRGRAGNDGFTFQFPLVSGETAIGCCPTGFTCQYGGEGAAQTCVSTASAGSFAAVRCSNGMSNGLHDYNLPATFTSTATYSFTGSELGSSTSTSTSVSVGVLSSVVVVAPLFQLHHQATDLPATSTSVSHSGTGTTQIPLFTSKSGNDDGGGGLSTGAVVGIGVGVGLGALALLGAVAGAFLHSRKRKQQQSNAAELVANEPKPPGFYYSQTVVSSGPPQPQGNFSYR